LNHDTLPQKKSPFGRRTLPKGLEILHLIIFYLKNARIFASVLVTSD